MMDFYAARPRVCGRPLRFGKRLELTEEEVLGEREHIRTLVRDGLVLLLDESGTPCPDFLEVPEYDPMKPLDAGEPPPDPAQLFEPPSEPTPELPSPLLVEPAEPPETKEEEVAAEAGEEKALELPVLDERELSVGEEHDEFLERILPDHVARRVPKVERKRKRPAKSDDPEG